MKIITFVSCLVVLFPLSLFAQKSQSFNYDYKVIYDYTFKPKKNDSAKVKEQTLLFCTEKDFYFASAKNHALNERFHNGEGAQVLAQQLAGNLGFSVVGHYTFTHNGILTTLERANARSFSYEEKPDLNWQIRSDTLTINGYLCQMATLLYGGRKWIAWFTADIPLAMGPYKFNGLPGLILKVEDEKNEFNWGIVSFSKEKTSVPWVYFYNSRNHEPVTRKEYFDYRIRRISDPFLYDRILNPSTKSIISAPEAAKKAYNNRAWKKDQDNWIEIE